MIYMNYQIKCIRNDIYFFNSSLVILFKIDNFINLNSINA